MGCLAAFDSAGCPCTRIGTEPESELSQWRRAQRLTQPTEAMSTRGATELVRVARSDAASVRGVGSRRYCVATRAAAAAPGRKFTHGHGRESTSEREDTGVIRRRLAALLVVAISLALVTPCASAGSTHTLTLVLDRTGQADVVLPSWHFDSVEATDTAKGVVAFELERQDEPWTVEGSNLVGWAVRLDVDRPMNGLFNPHDYVNGNPPYAAGRYRLSVTAAGGGSATFIFRSPDLERDITLRPRTMTTPATGGVQRLDTITATGDFHGQQMVSSGGVTRGFALVSIGQQTSTAGFMVGRNQVCLTDPEQECGPLGFQSQFVSSGPFGNFITALYAPQDVPTTLLSGKQRFTGGGTPSRAWGWSVLIAAPR